MGASASGQTPGAHQILQVCNGVDRAGFWKASTYHRRSITGEDQTGMLVLRLEFDLMYKLLVSAIVAVNASQFGQ